MSANIGQIAMQLTATAGQFMATMNSAAASYRGFVQTTSTVQPSAPQVQLGAYTATLSTAQTQAVQARAGIAATLGTPVSVAPAQFGTFMASLNAAQTSARMTSQWGGWTKGAAPAAGKTKSGEGTSEMNTLIMVGGKLSATYAAYEGIKWGLTVAAQAKRAEVAFEQLLGSAAKAKDLNKQIAQFSAASGIDPAVTRKGVQQLLVAQFTARDAMRVTQASMAAAATSPIGMAQGTEQITRALAQIKAKGKASAEEITQQLGEAGINGWQMIAAKLGKKVPEVMKLAEKGMIDSATAITAITEGMEKQYGGAIQKRAQTMEGSWEKMKAVAATSLAGVFDDRFQSGAARVLGWVGTIIDIVSKVFGVIEGLVTKVVGGISSAFEWLGGTMLGKGLSALWDMTGGAVGRWLGVGQAAEGAGKAIEEVGGKTKKAMDLAAQAIGPAQQAFNEWMKETKEAIQDFGLDEMGKKIAGMKRLGLDSGRVKQAEGVADQMRALEDQKKLMEEGKTLFEQMLNPAEKYYEETGKYLKMLNKGAIDQETYNRAVEKSGESYRQAQESLLKQNEAYTVYHDAVKTLTSDIEKLQFSEGQLMMKRLMAAGVSDAEMKRVAALQQQKEELQEQRKLAEDMKRLMEQSATPIQKAERQLALLTEGFKAGKITADQYRKLSKDTMREFASKGDNRERFAGAATRGSREAYSAIIAARDNSKGTSEQIMTKQLDKQIEANIKLQAIDEALRKNPNGLVVRPVEKK